MSNECPGNNQGAALEAERNGGLGGEVRGREDSEIPMCLYCEQADAELLRRGGGGRGRNPIF